MSQVFVPGGAADVEKLESRFYVPNTAPVAGIIQGYPATYTGYNTGQNLPEIDAYGDGSSGYVGIVSVSAPRLGIGEIQYAGESVLMFAARSSDPLVPADCGKPMFLTALATVSLTRVADTDPLVGVLSFVDAITGDFKLLIEQDKPPAGGAGFTSFDITDGVTTETINSGDTITFTDGTFIDQVVSAVDTVTADLSATGTPDATTFLRGDNTWATPGGGLSPGTTTGNMLYWDGAAWVETGAGPNNRFNAIPGSSELELINIAGNRFTRLAGTGNQFYANDGANNFRIATSGADTQIFSNSAPVRIFGQTYLGLSGDYITSPTSIFLQDNNFILNNSLTNSAVSKTWIPGTGLVQWGADPARWAFFPMGQININGTTGLPADAQYYKLGTQTIGNTSTGSYATYSFKVYYENNTTNHNETLKIELSHDGTNIVDTDYAFLSVDGGAREFQYITRYNAGDLEIGGYSTAVGANIRFNFVCETAGGIFA